MSRQSRPPVSISFEHRHGPSQAAMCVSEGPRSVEERRAVGAIARLQKNYQLTREVSQCAAAPMHPNVNTTSFEVAQLFTSILKVP